MQQTIDLAAVSSDAQSFLQEFLVGLLTTTRPNGHLHVAAVGFTYDLDLRQAWLIAPRSSVKVRNIAAGSRAVVAQVDGSRWLSLEGRARVVDSPEGVAEAHRRYRLRYPGHGEPDPNRVGIVIDVESMVGIAMRRPQS